MKFAPVAALLSLALTACGPVAKSPKHTEPATVKDDAAPRVDGPGHLDAPLTETECESLFNHAFQLIFDAQQSDRPIEERPSEDDMRQAKDTLRAKLLADCVGASRDAFPYECSMASDTLAVMKLCVGTE